MFVLINNYNILMKQTLTLSSNQHLAMTPKLQQAIRLLQLSTQMLDLEIKNLLEKNPLLEIEPENASDPSEGTSESLVKNSLDENLWQPDHDEIINLSEVLQTEDKGQEYQEWLYNRQSEISLKHHLLWQMNISSFKSKEQLIATVIIDAINDEGYLSIPLTEIQENLCLQYPDHEKFEVDEIENVLSKIQLFEPTGVCSRNLAECLSLQLFSLSKNTPFLQQAKNALNELDLIANREYKKLKTKLNITETEIKGVLELIRCLNPKPCSKYINLSGNYIIPDLKIVKKKSVYRVELNMAILPRLRLNPEYLTWMNRVSTQKGNESLKNHFNEARYFMRSLQIRNNTLLKVAEHITQHQQAFFEKGEEYLQPLNLSTIAHECNLHESTISRITTQKYIETPRGMFELKYFFASEVAKNQNELNKHLCNKAIRAFVRKMIVNESPLSPLSDAKISKMLLEEGIRISRRTVTKYREQMKIPSSKLRLSFLGPGNDVK